MKFNTWERKGNFKTCDKYVVRVVRYMQARLWTRYTINVYM